MSISGISTSGYDWWATSSTAASAKTSPAHTEEAEAAALATQTTKPTDGGALGNRGGFAAGSVTETALSTALTKTEAAYDTDGDGVLSADEKAAMYKALMEEMSSSGNAIKFALSKQSNETAQPNDGGPNSAEAEAAALATQTTRPTDGGALGNRGQFAQTMQKSSYASYA
jgi:hypothetical protein